MSTWLASIATLFSAKGDILTSSDGDTLEVLPVGTDGKVLTADSASPGGLKWSAAAGGGTAATTTFTPTGGIAATDVQAALAEVDTEKATVSALAGHTGDLANPHAVTKAQVGLSNVDNTSDVNKPVSTAQQAAIDLQIPKSLVDAKGDLLVGSANDTVVRKAVGTDGQVLTADAASAGGLKWASAGGGSRVLLKEITLAAATPTISFTSSDIPTSGYRSLEIETLARSDSSSGTNVGFFCTLNGDTSDANYRRELIYANGASALGDLKDAAASSRQLGGLPGATAVAGAAGTGLLRFPDFLDTTFHKIAEGRMTSLGATVVYALSAYRWFNTGAITSIDLFTTGNFVVGSKFRLYGIKDVPA